MKPSQPDARPASGTSASRPPVTTLDARRFGLLGSIPLKPSPKSAEPGRARVTPAAPAASADTLGPSRWLWAMGMCVFLVLGYALIARWNQNRFEVARDPWKFMIRWDDKVPAVPWTIWLYALYYPLVLTPLFIIKTRVQLLEVLAAYLIVSLVAWLSFLAIPVRMAYPALSCSGISCSMLGHLYAVDRGVNVFPSLHAAHTVLAAAIFCRYRSRLSGVMIFGASLVCLSAVLTRQHYLVDLPAGMALGLGAWALTLRLSPKLTTLAGRVGLVELRPPISSLELSEE